MEVLVLVDFNNVRPIYRRKGPAHVVELLCLRAMEALERHIPRFRVRLYDGWYRDDVPTRLAQDIATELGNQFPRVLPHSATGRRSIVVAELAYSLLSNPTHHLLHTYRSQAFSGNLRCSIPSEANCVGDPCRLRDLPEILRRRRCNEPGCDVRTTDVLTLNQQKLVDVMLATDLIDHTRCEDSAVVAVASSDDDLWPALQLAADYADRIVHIQTLKDRFTPERYTRVAGPTYVQISMEGK